MTSNRQKVHSSVEQFPKSLKIRDTGLHDDLDGPGQRIYTTVGSGYFRAEYIRADLCKEPAKESSQAEVYTSPECSERRMSAARTIVHIMLREYKEAQRSYQRTGHNVWDEHNPDDGVGGMSANPDRIREAEEHERHTQKELSKMKAAFEHAFGTFSSSMGN